MKHTKNSYQRELRKKELKQQSKQRKLKARFKHYGY